MLWIISEKKEDYLHLTDKLSTSNCNTKFFKSTSEAMKGLNGEVPDAFIIDADQSFVSSFEFCWILKSSREFKKIKIFIFSKNTDEDVEIQAFNSGADDFILKPIKEKSTVRRIISRLNPVSDISCITFQENGKLFLRIDKDAFSVHLNDTPVNLSKKEFELLYLMASQPGRVFSREEIFDKVWKRIPGKKDRTIDVHILRLRKKLRDDLFSTQKGIGYRFSA